MELTCSGNMLNSQYFIMSNKFTSLVDLVSHYFVATKDLYESSTKKEGGTAAATTAAVSVPAKTSCINIYATSLNTVAVIMSNAIQGIIDRQLIRDCVR